MDRAELFELAERVEALSGPDREVDCTIGRAIGFMPPEPFMTSSPWAFSPTYTGSLDAAMTLCQPDENRWPQLEYMSANPNNFEVGHRAWLWTKNGQPLRGDSMASGALAVCAAALRALAKEDS
jgi:hypothetical protein